MLIGNFDFRIGGLPFFVVEQAVGIVHDDEQDVVTALNMIDRPCKLELALQAKIYNLNQLKLTLVVTIFYYLLVKSPAEQLLVSHG